MAPKGVNDMHAVHMGAKIVHVYVQLYILVVILPTVLLKRRAELHIDTKNKTKGADIIQILAAYV
jgi:hypothetical protein